MTLLNESLSSPRCIISVMGDHAGEDIDAIIFRKAADIDQIGKTFWLVRSPKTRPAQVQEICRLSPVYMIFVEPATKGGARPTKAEDAAKQYSADGQTWRPIPKGLSPVTGKLDKGVAALVVDMMTTVVCGTLDLWGYADFSNERKPIKFILGCSTACAIKKDMTSHPGRMKSRYRGIVAVARLTEPYCVSLR